MMHGPINIKLFNSFLDSYLKIFYSSFPLKRVHFIAYRKSNNLDLINNYKRYCKTLSVVIKEAKKI